MADRYVISELLLPRGAHVCRRRLGFVFSHVLVGVLAKATDMPDGLLYSTLIPFRIATSRCYL